MNIVESLRIAMRALTANKMRAMLTMLGIIIGVAAVIALLSLGEGVQATVEDQIEGIGSNLLLVRSGTFGGEQDQVKPGRQEPPTELMSPDADRWPRKAAAAISSRPIHGVSSKDLAAKVVTSGTEF